MDAQRILKRQETLESRRSNFETLWEEVARRCFPRADDFRRSRTPGESRTTWQWDAFPGLALNRFASAMESGLTPRNQRWHRLTTGVDELDEQPAIRSYLDDLNEKLWRARYAAKSNFASQAHEMYQSLGAFGTGCMLIEAAEDRGIRYRACHIGDVYVAENADGVVDTVHRKLTLTARQALQEFGVEAPAKVRTAIERGDWEQPFEFLHVVMPREDYDPDRLDDAGKRFTDIYVCLESRSIVRSGGFYEMPYAVSRYVISPREVYGRSPAIMLLPDIKMLNEMRRDVIEAANMAVDPPTLLHDDAISEFRLEPGARNYGAVDDQGRQLAIPYQHGGDVGLGLDMIEDVKRQIDDGFLGVYFRVLLENPNMTATQALLIAQQQGQMTAPIVGRQQAEFLSPMIRREGGILARQGRMPEPPAELVEWMMAEGEPLGIEYESPMVRAARAEDAVAILRTFETLAPIAQVDPSIYRRFNFNEAARVVAEVNGVPGDVLLSDDEIAALDEQAAQQQALGAVLEAAPVAANTIKALSDAQRASTANPMPAGA